MARQYARLSHTQQVAPASRDRVHEQGPEPNILRLRHPNAFVVWYGWNGNFGSDTWMLGNGCHRSRLSDLRN